MQVQEAVQTKYAVRQFSDQPVPDNIMQQILNAGRRSQSSKNTQPWEFVVVRDADKRQALSKTGDYAGHLAGADFVVCIVGDKSLADNREKWEAFDFGQCAAYMQLAAWGMGVGSCIAAIYQPDQVSEIINLPDDKICWIALSFGYPAEDSAPIKMGGRKALDDLVHHEDW